MGGEDSLDEDGCEYHKVSGERGGSYCPPPSPNNFMGRLALGGALAITGLFGLVFWNHLGPTTSERVLKEFIYRGEPASLVQKVRPLNFDFYAIKFDSGKYAPFKSDGTCRIKSDDGLDIFIDNKPLSKANYSIR